MAGTVIGSTGAQIYHQGAVLLGFFQLPQRFLRAGRHSESDGVPKCRAQIKKAHKNSHSDSLRHLVFKAGIM